MAAALSLGLFCEAGCARPGLAGERDATGETELDAAARDIPSGDVGGCVTPEDAGAPEDSAPRERGAEDHGAEDRDEDAGPLLPCPDDMVAVGLICVDRYEASRDDATAEAQGELETVARSRPGVIPWHVEQMNALSLESFSQACAMASKRLCRPEEWFELCDGPDDSAYAFGHSFDRETCNCVDTFCDDYCAELAVAPESCNLATNCGYSCGEVSPATGDRCFHVDRTGSFPDCTNDYGAFDVGGNVWEVVPSSTDPRGYEVRGGAFNCAAAAQRLMCTYNASWTQLFAGFRCCRDRR